RRPDDEAPPRPDVGARRDGGADTGGEGAARRGGLRPGDGRQAAAPRDPAPDRGPARRLRPRPRADGRLDDRRRPSRRSGARRSQGRDARRRGRGPARAGHGAARGAGRHRRARVGLRAACGAQAKYGQPYGHRTPCGSSVPSVPPVSAIPRYRHALPHLDDAVFLTDGAPETTPIFHDGHDLPHFAAYDLLSRDGGEEALRRYFEPYVHIALEHGVGIVLETPTWRANPDWAALLGHSGEELEALNRRAVELLLELRDELETDSTPIVVSGCIGPRGDGYAGGETMSGDAAASYHGAQIRTFAEAGVDLVTAITMTYAN